MGNNRIDSLFAAGCTYRLHGAAIVLLFLLMRTAKPAAGEQKYKEALIESHCCSPELKCTLGVFDRPVLYSFIIYAHAASRG